MKLKHSFLIACLSAAPLQAQQEEKNEVKKAAAVSGEASASATATSNNNGTVQTETQTSDARSNRRQPQPNQPNQPPPQEPQKPVAYIGVLTREVPSELRSQFSLPEGFGLMVDEVMPDSPAQAAGLKVHDILVKFEDQRLVNMEQLMALVRAKKKGEVANLTVITGGKETQVPVTLGERMVAANDRRQQHGLGGWPQLGMPFGGGGMEQMQRGMRDMSDEHREQMERFQNEMREYQERLQNWTRNGNTGPMPQPPMFNVPVNPPADRRNNPERLPSQGPRDSNVQQFNFTESHAATNITRRDDTGEYTLKREDGKTTFIARPTNSKEQSWPVNTDEERQAVPEELRGKLRMMEGTGGRGGDDTPNPRPREGGGGNPPQSQRPQGRPTSA